MFSWFKKLFSRIRRQQAEPQRLVVEGVPAAPLTPEPDDAELAAEAFLEMMARPPKDQEHQSNQSNQGQKGAPRDAAYYHALASRIKKAQAVASFRATRFVAWCEDQLKRPDLPVTGPGSLQLMDAELYKRIDTVERMGGELKRRWQHCLAEVTVRLMKVAEEDRAEKET